MTNQLNSCFPMETSSRSCWEFYNVIYLLSFISGSYVISSSLPGGTGLFHISKIYYSCHCFSTHIFSWSTIRTHKNSFIVSDIVGYGWLLGCSIYPVQKSCITHLVLTSVEQSGHWWTYQRQWCVLYAGCCCAPWEDRHCLPWVFEED